MTVLRTAYCLFTEKSLVRDSSIGLGTSNHLAKPGRDRRGTPAKARCLEPTLTFLKRVPSNERGNRGSERYITSRFRIPR